MSTAEVTRAALAQRWDEAKANQASAFDELASLERQLRRIERDLADKQKWLRAFRGDDTALRDKLLDSAEFLTFDPVATEKECLQLLGEIRRKTAESKAVADKLDKAKAAERRAFYELHTFDHRAAVVEALRLEVSMFYPLRAEMRARNAVADREKAEVGTLPVLCRVDFGQFDITDGQSGVCHRIRDAVKRGYLTGEEDFLDGVAWKDSGVTIQTLLRRPQ